MVVVSAMETLHKVAWALRKVRLPVGPDSLVLDVGAGSCPYPRADVLLERYVNPVHRCGAPLVADRPIVFADALKMPFRDKAFDFVVASHVLEHVPEPERFLQELMRVGRAGYIETPNIFLERLCPYSIHVLEVMDRDRKLFIRKKPTQGSEDYLARLEIHQRHPKWSTFFYGVPQMFHVRHFWKDTISYQIDNPNEPCSWNASLRDPQAGEIATSYGRGGWREWGLRTLRRYYSWRRKSPIQWGSILACPECHGPVPERAGFYVCKTCEVAYRADPQPDFLEALPLSEVPQSAQ